MHMLCGIVSSLASNHSIFAAGFNALSGLDEVRAIVSLCEEFNVDRRRRQPEEELGEDFALTIEQLCAELWNRRGQLSWQSENQWSNRNLFKNDDHEILID